MSEDKLNITDLAPALAERTGMSKTQAEAFLKALFVQIETGLRTDHNVKMSGFGTFKLQWNGQRKSVDVNTGEEIIIDGYNKVVFVPESDVRERVNAPFSFLEPVELDDEEIEVTSSTVADDTHTAELMGHNLKALEEEADAIKALLGEINGIDCLSSSPEIVEQDDADYDVLPEDDIDEPVVENVSSQPVVTIETRQEVLSPETERLITATCRMPAEGAVESSVQPQQERFVPEPVADSKGVAVTPIVAAESKNVRPVKPYKNNTWKIMGGIAVGFCIVLVAVYFYMVYRVETWAENRITQTQAEHVNEHAVEKPIAALSQQQPIKEKPPQQDPVSVSVFDEPRIYTEFITTVELTAGSRLAWLSRKYYGSPDFWVYIYEANRGAIADPNNIPVGTMLRIPRLPDALINFNDAACVKYALELRDRYTTKNKP